jgi:hypothetical protein
MVADETQAAIARNLERLELGPALKLKIDRRSSPVAGAYRPSVPVGQRSAGAARRAGEGEA